MAQAMRGSKLEVAKRPLHILVVDDNLPLLQFLELLLEANGYQTTAASSPLQAALLAQSHRFDALITDLRMPHLNGHQLLNEVRQLRFNRHMPVLFISGQATNEFPELHSLELAHYLRKPFSGNDLLASLEQLLQMRSRLRHAEIQRHANERGRDHRPLIDYQTIPSPGI